VRYINCVYRRTGTLWEGRFKSALIDSEQYLLTCSRYIEMNPVRASMVEGPGEYRWSSYRANALGHNDKCVTPHYLYTQLGHNPEACRQAYLALFRTHVDDEVLSLIRRQTEQCTVIGDTRFQAEIQAMLKRRVIKQQHGGDRKSEAFVKTSSVLTP
jgi:putative transposase